MADTALNANLRKTATKSIVKEIRNNGGIPGVVYGKHVGSMAISVDAKDLKNILGSVTGRNTLINMNINGSKQTSWLRVDKWIPCIKIYDMWIFNRYRKIRKYGLLFLFN